MATILSMGGDQSVNLCTGLGGNVVTTNIAGRRVDYVSERPALLHIAGVSGSACSYLIEGSPDATFWFPLPTQDIPIGTPGAPGTLSSAVIVGGASPINLARLLPVDWPWQFVRVTMSGNTATLNTIDAFIL
jgi:hypothetical protein